MQFVDIREDRIPKRLYLSGPMTGIPQHNHPELTRVAGILRKAGFDVDNPAEHFDGDMNRPRSEYMNHDLRVVIDRDAVVLLKGWSESAGCNAEMFTAWQCGKLVYRYEDAQSAPVVNPPFFLHDMDPAPSKLPYSVDPSPIHESILQEADSLIHGARRSTYGHPREDYSKVAGMFNALFSGRLKPGGLFKPEDIPKIVILMKLSREEHYHKRDNLVDGAGYFGLIQMIIDEEKRCEEAKNSSQEPQEPSIAEWKTMLAGSTEELAATEDHRAFAKEHASPAAVGSTS